MTNDPLDSARGQMSNEGIGSLYIHIPFCKKKCNYCDFISYAGKENLIDEYVEKLIREFESLCSTFNAPLSTIYFGGGTPTLLEPRHFEKILTTLTRQGPKTEITIEANPGTANLAKLKELRQLGINRLSIGVQSFNDKHLNTLGRIHNANEAIKFYEDARSAGFDNINLDLIFALPGQTLDEWKADLQTALTLTTEPRSPEPVEGPNHLSTYNLQIEEGTPLWKMTHIPHLTSKPTSLPLSPLPDEETELAMYEYTIEILTAAGYNHYEISNFAKPGFECLHNINYWKNGNYIGIGAGAHSHVNGKRWSNPNCLEAYLQHEETAPIYRGRFPSAPDQRETIFMGLRLLDGLEIEKFASFEKEVTELTNDGLLERKNGNCRLTRRGLYIGNLVFEKFV